ncbi:hypothetical protein ACH5RR_040138 [Cinchona calisaya]|uniref:DUF1677 family protein n=1 Tax=Cinchona calisaya TaxID=153742 RepID=A0ABD2XRH8_9GENT
MAAIETQTSSEVSLQQQQMSSKPIKISSNDVVSAQCECCGLTEECTEAYIKRVRERFQGRWICGLCSEAVKDEVVRSNKRIGNEEALNLHMSFCKKFMRSLRPISNNPSTSPTPTTDDELISAVKQILLRSLYSPRKEQPLVRSKSCFSALER